MRKFIGLISVGWFLAACYPGYFTTTNTPSAYPVAPIVSTTIPYPAPNTTGIPALTPAPTLSYETPTPLPLKILSSEKLACLSQEPFFRCSDKILGYSFEYPATWGEVTAITRAGDTGIAYYYEFRDNDAIRTGGRSRDFSEGRGGWVTDFSGFGGKPAGTWCSTATDRVICQVIQPVVVFVLVFPEGRTLCDPIPESVYTPTVRIAIDLPNNSAIGGFIFDMPLSAPELNQQVALAMSETLDYTDSRGATRCDRESQVEFDSRISELINKARANGLNSETQNRIELFKQIAHSISSQ